MSCQRRAELLKPDTYGLGLSRKVQIKIFDIYGNDYCFFEIEGKNNITTEKLDLKELAAGVYFISFSGNDFSEVKKIVIQ